LVLVNDSNPVKKYCGKCTAILSLVRIATVAVKLNVIQIQASHFQTDRFTGKIWLLSD
jgi:hypothetical protein